MNSELSNQQTDWLAQTEELNDIEASQVNGGISPTGGLGGLGGAEEVQQQLGALIQQVQEGGAGSPKAGSSAAGELGGEPSA